MDDVLMGCSICLEASNTRAAVQRTLAFPYSPDSDRSALILAAVAWLEVEAVI